MLCDCSCDVDNENEIEHERELTARKRWQCCECREPIEPGERYQLYTLYCNENWSKIRTCLPCARIRASLCDCWTFGGLYNTIWKCLGFNYLTGEYNPDWDPRSYHAEAV